MCLSLAKRVGWGMETGALDINVTHLISTYSIKISYILYLHGVVKSPLLYKQLILLEISEPIQYSLCSRFRCWVFRDVGMRSVGISRIVICGWVGCESGIRCGGAGGIIRFVSAIRSRRCILGLRSCLVRCARFSWNCGDRWRWWLNKPGISNGGNFTTFWRFWCRWLWN